MQYKHAILFLKTLEKRKNENVQEIGENLKEGLEIEQKNMSRGFERS